MASKTIVPRVHASWSDSRDRSNKSMKLTGAAQMVDVTEVDSLCLTLMKIKELNADGPALVCRRLLQPDWRIECVNKNINHDTELSSMYVHLICLSALSVVCTCICTM